MHAEIDRLLAAQHECVGHWQLVRPDRSAQAVGRALARAGLRTVEDGVWTSARAELSPLQRRAAASLTAPDTALSHADAVAHWGASDHSGPFVTVVRRGTGGPRRVGDVLVSRTPRWIAVERRGVLVTLPARSLMDLAPHVEPAELRRATIEMLRLKHVPCTFEHLQRELEVGARRPAAKRLRVVVEQLAGLPIGRTRSNAEGEALFRLREAGRKIPAVNVKVGGFEADLVDRERRTITEVDGPAFHADPERDARRDAAWVRAGFTVRRRPSDDAFDPDAAW